MEPVEFECETIHPGTVHPHYIACMDYGLQFVKVIAFVFAPSIIVSLSLSLCLSFASLRQHARVVQTPSRLIRRPLLSVVRGANSLDIFQHRATQVHDGVFSTTPVATAELKSLMTAEEHQTCYVKARVCL